MMIIKPLGNVVYVLPDNAEQKTASGIIIPATAQEKPQRGIIKFCGPGDEDKPMTVKPGDKVLYGKYAGTEWEFEGNNYLIMREGDLLGILIEDTNA